VVLALALTLVSSAALHGRVVDQLERPRVVTVCSAIGCVETNARGEFTFEQLPRGRQLVQVSATTPASFEPPPSVEVQSGANPVVLRVRAFSRVRAEVVDEAGTRLPAFRIDDLSTDSDHAVPFERLPARVEVSAPGLATEVVALPAPDAFGDVDLGRVTLTKGRAVTVRVATTTGVVTQAPPSER
jgi:hypothetical protein